MAFHSGKYVKVKLHINCQLKVWHDLYKIIRNVVIGQGPEIVHSKSIGQEYKTYPKIQVNSGLFKLAQISSNFWVIFLLSDYYNVSSVTQASNNHIPFIELWMTVAVRILNILIIKEERKIRGHISKLQVWRWYFAEKSHAEPEEKKDIPTYVSDGPFPNLFKLFFFYFFFCFFSSHLLIEHPVIKCLSMHVYS